MHFIRPNHERTHCRGGGGEGEGGGVQIVFAKYSIMSNRTSFKQQLRYYRTRYISHTPTAQIRRSVILAFNPCSTKSGNYFTTSVIGKIPRSGPQR